MYEFFFCYTPSRFQVRLHVREDSNLGRYPLGQNERNTLQESQDWMQVCTPHKANACHVSLLSIEITGQAAHLPHLSIPPLRVNATAESFGEGRGVPSIYHRCSIYTACLPGVFWRHNSTPPHPVCARDHSMSGLAQFVASRGLGTLQEWCEEGYHAVSNIDKEISSESM